MKLNLKVFLFTFLILTVLDNLILPDFVFPALTGVQGVRPENQKPLVAVIPPDFPPTYSVIL
jgi:hypothetical protein